MQEAVWDAVAVSSTATASRVAAVLSPQLLQRLVRAALGRNSKAELRITALHALAGCAGAEMLGPRGSPGGAMLSAQVLTCR